MGKATPMGLLALFRAWPRRSVTIGPPETKDSHTLVVDSVCEASIAEQETLPRPSSPVSYHMRLTVRNPITCKAKIALIIESSPRFVQSATTRIQLRKALAKVLMQLIGASQASEATPTVLKWRFHVVDRPGFESAFRSAFGNELLCCLSFQFIWDGAFNWPCWRVCSPGVHKRMVDTNSLMLQRGSESVDGLIGILVDYGIGEAE